MENLQVNIDLIIEIASVVLGLVYLILVMMENIWCWIFGITSSVLSVYLFLEINLLSEAILYVFYAAVGVYGWVMWSRKKAGKTALVVRKWKWQNHAIALPIGFALSAILGWIMSSFTKSEMSYVDAHTTMFSFIASYLEAQKVLSAWFYWIVINGVSVWLYFTKGLNVYGWLMVLYFVMSFAGLYMWNKTLKLQHV
ncbi:MAG: nicotinamide riboside transporter PnuC [Salibacteraceae bacterium]|nr:nicotinamide riboside transporter PnuC [Salibacteraceae bacterium]